MPRTKRSTAQGQLFQARQGAPGEKPLAEEQLITVGPKEDGISEGNLAELPIWVLSNKEARPMQSDGSIRPEDYVRRFVLREESPKGASERRVVIAAHQQYGFPTMFAYRTLMAVCNASQERGLSEQKVPITRFEIAQRLGLKSPGKTEYTLIRNALDALKNLNVEFHDTWYDKSQERRLAREASKGLVYDFDFVDARKVKDDSPARIDDLPHTANYVILSDSVWKSLKNGYYFGIDMDYMNALSRPLAERLYSYLTKKDYREHKFKYQENLKNLAIKLGLKSEAPSVIMRSLGPALDSLKSATMLVDRNERVRFVQDWKLSEDQKSLTVFFFHKNSPHTQLARSLSGSH